MRKEMKEWTEKGIDEDRKERKENGGSERRQKMKMEGRRET